MTTYTTKGRRALDGHAKAVSALAKLEEATRQAIEEGNQAIEWVVGLAVENGMSDKKATLYNAQAFIESDYATAKSSVADVEQWAQSLGYDSFARARMAIGARTNRHDQVTELLPPLFKKMPVELALNKSQLERGRIERTLRRVQRDLLDTFEQGLDATSEQEMAEWWSELKTLADLDEFHTEVLKYNNDYEEPTVPETISTAEMVERIQQATRFSVQFIEDVVHLVESRPVAVERTEGIYRANCNADSVVEFVLWQHIMPSAPELQFERLMHDFTFHLADRGLAIGETQLINKVEVPAGSRQQFQWSEGVCLNDLLAFIGSEASTGCTSNAIEAEETDDELLACLAALG